MIDMETAFVLINCDGGSEKPIINQLKSLNDVKEVHGTFGIYDIIATVESSEQEALKKIISGQIRNIDHVTSTLTLIDMGSDDEQPDLIPDVIPEEKKPLEPPNDEEFEEEEDDEDDFKQKNKKRYKSVYKKRYRE